MKIIALVPVKNESWALPSYLSSVLKVADEIIALDDSSADDSRDILEKGGARVISYDASHEQVVDMSARRRRLLDAGRKAGGTHFIWLDADETFSADFIPQAREVIRSLTPGQKITMRWVHAWKSPNEYLIDERSPFGYIWKDFIACDQPDDTFEEKFLSEARTPGAHETLMKISDEQGVVLHWQFSRWQTTQYKQALYRCTELIKSERSARRINHTYSITLDNKTLKTQPINKTWTNGLSVPMSGEDIDVFKAQIFQLFDTYGIEFFEPLQIWHIKELHDEFLKRRSYTPKSKVFPGWLVRLNHMRIFIENKFK